MDWWCLEVSDEGKADVVASLFHDNPVRSEVVRPTSQGYDKGDVWLF